MFESTCVFAHVRTGAGSFGSVLRFLAVADLRSLHSRCRLHDPALAMLW